MAKRTKRMAGIGDSFSPLPFPLSGLGAIGDYLPSTQELMDSGRDLVVMAGGAAAGLVVSEVLLGLPKVRDLNPTVKIGLQAAYAVGLAAVSTKVRGVARGAVLGAAVGAGFGVISRALNAFVPQVGQYVPTVLPPAKSLTAMWGYGGAQAALPAAGTAGVYIDGRGQGSRLEGMGAVVATEAQPQSYPMNGLGEYTMHQMSPEQIATL